MRPKYCSKYCTKKSWYLRKNPNAKSFLKTKEEFFNTETGVGHRWEEYVAEKLGATHLKFNKFGCDLNWNGKKVDVKSCNLYKRKFKRGEPVLKEQKGCWVFNRNKLKKVDFFICVCLIENKLFKTYKIPAINFPLKGATIGWDSKYKEFEIVL